MTDADSIPDHYETGWEDPNQDVAETVMWAAGELKPLIVTLHDGRVVRFTPTAV